MNKKSYFFTLDAMLSLGILILGSFLIFTSYTKVPSKAQTGILAEDVMDLFATTKIKDLNNPYGGVGGDLWKRGYITNSDNSLLQQIGEFYYEYEKTNNEAFKNTAENFIVSVIKEIVPLQYNFEFWIEDTRLYPSSPTQQHINSKEKTKILLPSKAITYGILDNELFGPYEIEVLIWE